MKKEIFLTLLLISATRLAAQAPFFEDIQVFKQQDAIQPPPRGEILFIGSSSFTMWTDLGDYFPGFTLLNRGFGGSQLTDQIRYLEDIVFPYEPRQIVIYCGENDLAMDTSIGGQVVFERFLTLFYRIRERLPQADIVYVSMKPSPSRRHLMPKMQEGNRLIQQFLAQQPAAAFADVFTAMLLPDGSPNPSIFTQDQLHMNIKGYEIWKQILLPHLK